MSNAPIPSEPPRDVTSATGGDTGRPPGDTAHPAGLPLADPEIRKGCRPVPEYLLVDKLGEGSFGQVWKALDDNGKEIALKFMRHVPSAGNDEVAELGGMKNVGHPHLLVMYRYWRLGNWLVLALELAEGSLEELWKSKAAGRASIPLPELVEYFREAAKGLDYLHSRGLQHRDVKPANLLLVGGGVKVADFGLVKLLSSTLATNTNRNIAGTPAFAAPEVWQGKTSRNSDQYALAVSWCQLHGGKRPFRGEDLMSMAWAHTNSDPDLSMIPAAERPAVAKALSKQPEQRWPSCRAFVEALAAGASAETSADAAPTVRPKAPYPRRRSRWYAVVGSVLLGVLAAGITISYLTPGADRPAAGAKSAQTGAASPDSGKHKADGPAVKPEPVAVLRLEPLAPVALRAGEKATLVIRLRGENLPDRIELVLDQLPAGVKAAPARLDAGSAPARLTLTAAADAAAGEADVTLIARAGGVRDEGHFRLSLTPAVVVRQRLEPLDCTGKTGVSAADVRRAQEAWAKYLGRKVEETVEIAGGVTMTFVLVPPGKFHMGSPEGELNRYDDETLHTVTLTEPFDLGKYEVTQAQYQALVTRSQSEQLKEKDPSKFKGEDRPVEMVSWNEADAFGRELTKLRSDKHEYRLPTEAEWEYSCRGGRPSAQPFGIGDGRSLASREANFNGKYPFGGAAEGRYLQLTCEVGSYAPNALGLYDMHGNAWEWCFDRYGPYPRNEITNPGGVTEGGLRVRRGGGWFDHGKSCRAAYRSGYEPGYRDGLIGFRLARSVPPGGK